MKFRVSSHTDYIESKSTYVAIAGNKYDGIDFIEQAIERGATKIVLQSNQSLAHELIAKCKKKSVAIEYVLDTRKALAELSAQAYDYPSKKLKILAVTGTDGKTTSTYLLYHILKNAGKKVALLSGVQNIIGDQIIKSDLTTAKPDFLHYFFYQCVQAGIEYVAMEVSAQATTLHRIDGIEFDACIFTNLAHEHGECYSNLEDYFAAKCDILRQKKSIAPIIVHAGAWSEKVKQQFGAVISCGFASENDYQVVCLQETLNRQLLEIKINNQWHQFNSALIGDYNALNITGAVAFAHILGIPPEVIAVGVRVFSGAQGRLERFVLPNGSIAVVDYAHTPQAYKAILYRLKKYARRLTVVFGAAGNKDVNKRPIMGKIAAQNCDLIVLTNDNPRYESPESIMNQVMAELTADERNRVFCEPDRVRAINSAYAGSQAGDIIAILGKGGERVQIMGNERIPHSDEQVINDIIAQKVF